MLALLIAATAAFFAFTYAINRSYQAHRENTARAWFADGESEMRTGHPTEAQEAYRSALAYEPGNRLYTRNLALALAAAGKDSEATAYLTGLLQQEPGDGQTNLELARLAVRKHDVMAARNYFHGAIYGAWSTDPQNMRRRATLELVRFLLQEQEITRAHVELVDLAADLPRDAQSAATVAALFAQANDPVNALFFYREAIGRGATSADVLEGAGRTAFQLGEYKVAADYLRQAAEAGAGSDIGAMRETASAILSLDPYASDLTTQQRTARVALIFAIAGNRLQACGSTPGLPTDELTSKWKALKPRMESRALGRDAELLDNATDVALRIEGATQSCPAATAEDEALQRIASAHAGGQR